ncbi:MAG TPA: hypothetical protein VKY36_03065 [Moheibacter sp.]|nr:hypothetical protein [Moheibacter sp.]
MKTHYFGILFFFIFAVSGNAQDRVTKLLDSLAAEKNDEKIIDLNLKIASELKFKDKVRTTYYINLAEKKAEEINSETTWKKFYARAFEIYSDMDALDLSLNYLLKEYDYYKNSNDLKKYELENKLGIINARLNNPEKALVYFKKILPRYLEEQKFDFVGKTYNNIGLAYLSIEKPDSALYFLQKGLKSLEKKPDLNILIHLKTNIARCYAILKEENSAERNFEEASQLMQDSTSSGIKTWVHTERAKFYLDTGNFDKAIEFAQTAEQLEPSKNNFIYAQILKVLYKAYYQKSDYKNAAYYFNLFDEVRDNLNIEEKAVNVEKLKIEYDYKIRAQQNEIEENRKQLNFIAAIGGLVILLLILSIFMIRYKNRLVKIKLENQLKELKEKELKLELELKNKALASKTIRETEQNELINIVQKDLKEIQSKAIQSETKEALNQLFNKIKFNASQNNWEEFDMRFSNVYESFFEKLNELHPNLSPHDKRICALIKLNLSTKEIANLTKTSVKSVENIRTRLRKKLGLTNQRIDLTNYLSEF